MKKVIIPTKLESICREVLEAAGGYTVVQEPNTGLVTLAAQHPDAYALIVRSEPVTPGVIDAFPSLRVIVRAGAGYDTIDTRYARARGVDVMNTPGANSNAVAEEVIALVLADMRHIIRGDQSTRAGAWEKGELMGQELAGKTVGIVGLGHIGQLLARRLAGFDVVLLGLDPVISRERAGALGIELVGLEDLFSRSDIVSLHVPETAETRGMVDAALLARMKPNARIVNCARAGIIDEAAVRAARAERGLRFLNDVYPKDAPGPKSVADIADILLPHLGANTVEANTKAARRAAEQLVEFDQKGVTSYIVNRDIPEGLDRSYCELSHAVARLCLRLAGSNVMLKMIETSFYGSLADYERWLVGPMVAGLWEDFDRSLDHAAALAFLESRGIAYNNRPVDAAKGYGNSITVDLIGNVRSDQLVRASVRGTVAEGRLVISRINEFDKLYFEPVGPILCFVYDDRPGVLGQIAGGLAEAGVNIEDVRNPHNKETGLSLAVLQTNVLPTAGVVQRIAGLIRARSAFAVSL